MDLLLWLRKKVHPLANKLGLRPLGRAIFRPLLRLRYGKDGLANVHHNGRTWKLHTDVALRGEHAEFDTVLWLRKVIRPGDCVFDVGANVGQMTLEAAELVGPTGRVIAIEPAAGNLKLLRSHIAANGYADRVEVVAAACGEHHNTQISFYIAGTDENAVGSGHSAVKDALAEVSNTVRVDVPVVSLDALCRERGLAPAVLKIDVEGAELGVLRGARETLKGGRPHLRFGFHPFAFEKSAETTREIRALLEECGYDAPASAVGGSYELEEYVPALR